MRRKNQRKEQKQTGWKRLKLEAFLKFMLLNLSMLSMVARIVLSIQLAKMCRSNLDYVKWVSDYTD